jgi:hypothetical protein
MPFRGTNTPWLCESILRNALDTMQVIPAISELLFACLCGTRSAPEPIFGATSASSQAEVFRLATRSRSVRRARVVAHRDGRPVGKAFLLTLCYPYWS